MGDGPGVDEVSGATSSDNGADTDAEAPADPVEWIDPGDAPVPEPAIRADRADPDPDSDFDSDTDSDSDPDPEPPVPDEVQAPTYYVDATSSGWRVAAVIGLLITGLLIAGIVVLWQKVDDVEGNVPDEQESVIAARGAVAPLEQTMGGLQKTIGDLQASVTALQASVGTANTDFGALVAAVKARLDTVVTCVNTYMDVIARWSVNTATTYAYDRCV